MIIGLSISSQVNDAQRTTKPTIVATPDVIKPTTGTGVQRISCSGGNGYYVSDGCACCNIYCTNGNRYTICVCNDGSSGFLRVAKPNTNPKHQLLTLTLTRLLSKI